MDGIGEEICLPSPGPEEQPGACRSAARCLWLAKSPKLRTLWKDGAEQVCGECVRIELILRSVAGHVPGSIGVVFELQSGARGEGFLVAELVPGGSAERSTKVAVGDRLLRVDGTPIGASPGISKP